MDIIHKTYFCFYNLHIKVCPYNKWRPAHHLHLIHINHRKSLSKSVPQLIRVITCQYNFLKHSERDELLCYRLADRHLRYLATAELLGFSNFPPADKALMVFALSLQILWCLWWWSTLKLRRRKIQIPSWLLELTLITIDLLVGG